MAYYPAETEMYMELRLYCGSEACLVRAEGKAPRPRKHTVGFLVYDCSYQRDLYALGVDLESDWLYKWSFRESVENRPASDSVDVLRCPRCKLAGTLEGVSGTQLEQHFSRHPEQKKTSLQFLLDRGLLLPPPSTS